LRPSDALAALLATLAGSVLLMPVATPGRKIVVAHRGASGYLPEHTFAAKAMAHAMGADYLEQDVVLSKDGIPIVLHDVILDAVTDAATVFAGRARGDEHFYAIDFTLDELRQLTVMERANAAGEPLFPARFPRGAATFHIATLAEEIELVQGLNLSTGREAGIYPEVKKPAWHHAEGYDAAASVLAVLADYGYTGKDDAAFVQCFDWNETRRIRTDLGYRGKLVQLLDTNDGDEAPFIDYDALRSDDGLAAIAEVADGIGPRMADIVAGVGADGRPQITDLVAQAHARGLAVHPFTLRADALPAYADSLEDLLRILLVDAQVDGVFTDFPDRAVAFIRGNL